MKCFYFLCILLSLTYTSHAQTKTTLRHVVMVKFTSSSTPEDIKKVEEAFRALPGKIKVIKAFEWGTNTSPEKLNEGLTHCFFLTFSSDKDRDEYLVHPQHKVFTDLAKPFLERAVVLDYWAGK